MYSLLGLAKTLPELEEVSLEWCVAVEMGSDGRVGRGRAGLDLSEGVVVRGMAMVGLGRKAIVGWIATDMRVEMVRCGGVGDKRDVKMSMSVRSRRKVTSTRRRYALPRRRFRIFLLTVPSCLIR